MSQERNSLSHHPFIWRVQLIKQMVITETQTRYVKCLNPYYGYNTYLYVNFSHFYSCCRGRMRARAMTNGLCQRILQLLIFRNMLTEEKWTWAFIMNEHIINLWDSVIWPSKGFWYAGKPQFLISLLYVFACVSLHSWFHCNTLKAVTRKPFHHL